MACAGSSTNIRSSSGAMADMPTATRSRGRSDQSPMCATRTKQPTSAVDAVPERTRDTAAALVQEPQQGPETDGLATYERNVFCVVVLHPRVRSGPKTSLGTSTGSPRASEWSISAKTLKLTPAKGSPAGESCS